MSSDLRQLVDGIALEMGTFHEALGRCADEMSAKGGDAEVVMKLVKGVDAMKDSANIYLSWARHYVGLSAGGASEADEGEEDLPDFQF